MADQRDAQALTDEARKLLGLAQDWARRTIPEHTGPECQWCPLCQFASILRGEHPEVTERVVEAGTALTGAFRALLDTATRGAPSGDAAPADAPGRPKPAPRVQRIRLDDEPPGSPPADPADGPGVDDVSGDDTGDNG